MLHSFRCAGWVVLTAVLCLGGSLGYAGTLTFPGPAPCDTTLQACFDGANSGDTVEIATNERIDEPGLTISKSLSLKAAEGFFPIIGAAPPAPLIINRLSVSNQLSGVSPMSVAIDGINFDNSEVQAFLPNGSGHAFEFTNNRVAFNTTTAVRGVQVLPSGATTFLIEGNSFFCSDTSILIWPNTSSGSVTGTIQGNIVTTLDPANSREGISIDHSTGSASIDIFNNVIYGLGLTKGALDIKTSGTSSMTVNVTNNTFDNLTDLGFQGQGIFLDLQDTSSLQARVFNNIFSNLTNHVFYFQNNFPNAFLTLAEGNNDFFNVELEVSNDVDFSADASDLDIDPLYQNAAAADYRLQSSSQLIDAGDDSPTGGLPPLDFAGFARIAGDGVDLGAFEVQADLSIVKTADVTAVEVGDDITYTLTVANAGSSDAEGVHVTDTLPGGATFVSATPSQGACSGTAIVDCDLGMLAADATATVTLVVTADQAGTLTNAASVSGSLSDTNTANNESSVDVTVSNPSGGGGSNSSSGGCRLQGASSQGHGSAVFLLLCLPLFYFSFRAREPE